MDTLEALIEENRAAHAANAKALAENTAITKEIKDAFDALKGGFKVLGWIGAAAKWVAAVVTAGGVLWALLHGSKLP